MSPPDTTPTRSRNLFATLTIVGAIGAGLVYTQVGQDRFWANWLVWTLYILTLGLGSLFIVALERLVGAHWSVPMRRVPERIASLIPLGSVLLLIGLFAVPVLFPWTHHDVAHHPIVAAKAAWLNLPFFVIRSLVCVALWLSFYFFFVRGSLRQDHSKDPLFTIKARRWAPPFMILFFFTVTIMAFDWISSLEPEWYSDMFGVYLFAGSFISGIAAMILGVSSLYRRGRLEQVTRNHYYNLGSLGIAFTVFYAYISFAQYMLIWYANLPEEVLWVKHRVEGAWGPVALLLPIFHFIVPFLLLIGQAGRGSLKILRLAAFSILFAHFVDLYWLIFPVLGKTPQLGWPELSMACLFIGLAGLQLRRAMRHGADMPVGDPLLAKGLEWQL